MNNRRLLNDYHFIGFNCKDFLIVLVICLSLLLGCSHTEKILVPPEVDLKSYKAIGVIDFSSNGASDLREHVTQNYIQTVQSAQPGVRFLELGSKQNVLTRLGRKQLDPEAIKSIGSAYNVEALFFGQFNVSEPKPNIKLSSTWQKMHAGAHVEASLMVKLWETESGVTLWTNSTQGKEPVASLTADTSGNFDFGASDPQESYGQLVSELVYANTADFRPYYVYRKVK
jgi:hypothetical protein